MTDTESYRKVLRIMNSTYERDKFSKILQYGYKYYSWKAANEGLLPLASSLREERGP